MALEVLFRDAGNAVGLLDGRVLVQVRWGEITRPAVEAIGAAAQRCIAPLAPDEWIGALLVQEPGAGVPDSETREAQRNVIRPVVAGRKNARLAGVVMGDDLSARLRLTMVRMLTVGDDRFRHFSTVDDAITWLTRELPQVHAPTLRAAFDTLRARG